MTTVTATRAIRFAPRRTESLSRGTATCATDAARRPRQYIGSPPARPCQGSPVTCLAAKPPTCHHRPRARFALPPPLAESSGAVAHAPQGNLRARRRSRFGLSLGLPRLPHPHRSAAGFFRFPLGGPPTANERPAGEENISGDGLLMKNKARWQCGEPNRDENGNDKNNTRRMRQS